MKIKTFSVMMVLVMLFVTLTACTIPQIFSNDKSNPNEGSVGLIYVLNDDKTAYAVVGIGFCTDTQLVIPSQYNELPVTTIGEFAFYDCESLTSVVIPDSVTSIGWLAFWDCESLTSVVIPDSVTSISGGAFYNCKSLTDIAIPNSVTSIDEGAFYNCESLTDIAIPNSVTSIGNDVFYGCESLTSVHISDMESWCAIAFHDGASNPLCYANNLYLNGKLVTDLVIPDSMTSIRNSTFYVCTSLTSIEIPDCVTSIGDNSFYWCTRLTSITIPNSVTSIGYDAFSGCTGLTTVYYGGTAENWNAISIAYGNDDNLTSATIYYYIETAPTTTGNYWHYVDGVPTKW